LLNITDDKILELHNKGMSNKDIAQAAGCAACTISQHLRKMGVSTYRIDNGEIMAMHNAGMTDREIAEILGCERSNVTIFLNRRGVSGRHGKKDNVALRNQISQSLIGRFVQQGNPNFKGTSTVKQRARGISKTIVKDMIRNSDGSCMLCGQKGEPLVGHHIYPFSNILNEFLTNVFDGNPDTLYDQLVSFDKLTDRSNIMIVCKKCHKAIHDKDNPELAKYRRPVQRLSKDASRRNRVEYTQAGGSAGALSESVI
jgi:5-methylcytosine-specific restriction endonuclease McrA/DNA-binding CsgD family transcriptional regulator